MTWSMIAALWLGIATGFLGALIVLELLGDDDDFDGKGAA